MGLIIKRNKIRWFKNVVRIQKQFYKLKFNLRFMIYLIHVFTYLQPMSSPMQILRCSFVQFTIQSDGMCNNLYPSISRVNHHLRSPW